MRYCIKDEFFRYADFEQEIMAIAISNFDSVFLTMRHSDKTTITDAELLEKINLCKKHNVPVEFVHLQIDKELNDLWDSGENGKNYLEKLKNTIYMCKQNGIQLFVMHGYYKDILTTPTKIGLERFFELAEFCKSLNVYLAIENVDNVVFDYYLLKNLNAENVGFCFDTGHFNTFGSYENRDILNEFKHKLLAVHIHDNDGTKDAHNLPQKAENSVDFERFMPIIKQNLSSQCFTLEVTEKYFDEKITLKTLTDYLQKAYNSLEKIVLDKK